MTSSPPSDRLIQLLSEHDLRVGELALELREMVLREAPTATETLFKSYALSMSYSLTDRWSQGFCYVAVYRKHVNLGFLRGAELEDPENLLVGSGALMRHLSIRRPEDLKQRHIRAFIRAAIKHSKSMLDQRTDKRPRK
jgi:hypothetical protein